MKSKLVLAFLLLLGLVVTSLPAVAQQGEPVQPADEMASLRQEIVKLQNGQAAMRQQLQEIKNMLAKGAAAAKPGLPDVEIDLAGAPFLGDADAPITIVEFSDFQCPFCARHVQQTLPKLQQSLIAEGKLKYVASDFPLPTHKQAFKASVAAHCAQEQDKFWEMSAKIFENYRTVSPETLPGFAEAVGLNVNDFNTCLASGKYDAMISAKKREAQKAGVGSTPNFLVGYTQKGSTKFKAKELIKGAVPYENFKSTVERLLKDQGNAK